VSEEGCGCSEVTSVKFNHHVRAEMCAADYGAYSAFAFAGIPSEQAIQILGHDDHRYRALVYSDAPVWVGKKEQITNGTPSGWRQIATIPPLEIRNKQPVFIMHTGVAANVYVVNERWEGDGYE
jgi:hypothetical protein